MSSGEGEVSFKVTLPDGRKVVITETSICIKGSEEKCMIIGKDLQEILLDYAVHQGWSVKKVE